ncbi:MAG TPA: NYN domain-containing protein [Candidatus Pullichristensenella excrementigallinarum]|uniref:NYN domain-containing protein n=1 Tax=Candidatus Pullichristensenella excrementigallinarum TaxID=2840907 RepID=A0A9D1LB74_9FIRM|nr:NYN domain-containing protein [Candidatus Pullichristensenella excrementigallinarum]
MNRQKLLVVDGYNVINAWKSVSSVQGGGREWLADARDQLTAKLQNYAGYTGQKVVLVFDAYLSQRPTRTEEQMGPVTVVYTQKGETADHYIERLCDQWAERAELGLVEIRVATSDLLEQTLVLGRYATRLSSRELLREIHAAGPEQRRQEFRSDRTLLIDRVPEDVRRRLESLRRGEQYQSEDGNP